MKITQVFIEYGTAHKIVWVPNPNRAIRIGDKVKYPDDDRIWKVTAVYSSEDAATVHSEHNSDQLKACTDI